MEVVGGFLGESVALVMHTWGMHTHLLSRSRSLCLLLLCRVGGAMVLG
jgi:hypothetical protein